MISIDDRTFDALEWAEVDGAELHNIITGQTVTGAEPIDYPDTDGILISLQHKDTGIVTVLEVMHDSLTDSFYICIAKCQDKNTASIQPIMVRDHVERSDTNGT